MFHNGFTYDYHFIIRELAEEFEGEFECLGENTEKNISIYIKIFQCQSKRKSQKKIRMEMIKLLKYHIK